MISTLYLCPETLFSQGFAQIRITLSSPASPPSPPPRYPADGGVTEVVAAVPTEVCGVSVKEVSHNAKVTMAIFIGSSGLKKHLDSSLVTELKIASSQELVFSSNASVRG